jgi:hypothetical protein
MCYVYLMVNKQPCGGAKAFAEVRHCKCQVLSCSFTWGQVINLKMQAIASTQLWVCCMIQLQRIGVVISYFEYAETNLCCKKRRD